MFRKSARWIVIALAVVTSLAGGWAYHQHWHFKHFAVHEPRMMYRSAWLEADALAEVIEEHQIRAVINLCRPGEMGKQRWVDERRAVAHAGARLIELPMPTGIEAADPQIAKHLEVLRDPNNYPMLVHCQHGVTRTAKHLAIYDIVFRGMSAEDSLNSQPFFGRDDHNVNVRAFVKNFEKTHRTLYPTASAKSLKVLGQ